jgi:putative NIF3 family GTP cyclohydrolase 1 type 2
MKLSELFAFFIERGISSDPRGEAAVRLGLAETAERYGKLSEKEKLSFDRELLTNPYPDSRILHATGNEELRSIMVGIDIEAPELLLADTLRAKGKVVDAVLAHHPEGHAYATFYEVMDMQADLMNLAGVPINIAESLTQSRKKEVGRKVAPQNHMRSVDTARLLGIPFMNTHTIADNHVAGFLQNIFDGKKPRHLKDIIDILESIPEYQQAGKLGNGPNILVGGKESRAGKIFVDMTGGTEGHKEAMEKLAQAGVGTIVGMHMSDEHFKNAEKYRINVILAGHISSDNLGMNLLLDSAEKKFGKIECIECSGFRRVRHGS